MGRYEAPQTAAEAVADFREANAALRKIAKGSGRTAATINAIFRWQRIADRASRYLLDSGERKLAGLVTAEADLADRIAECPELRPELQHRLRAARSELRLTLSGRRLGLDASAEG